MEIDVDPIRAWLSRPREALDRELKGWLVPTTNEADRANLVKGMLALRNRNGGMIAIGFDNTTGKPLVPPPMDWTGIYHVDQVQRWASKHSSQQFEVTVSWFPSDVGTHPVITVPSGVRTPVAVKSPISISGKPILPMETVYFRTLNSNNTPSSAPASYRDWDEITRFCFENREADIGMFVRRHLSAASIPAIFAAFGVHQADESLSGRSQALLDEGERRFQEAYAAAGVQKGHEEAANWGYNAVAMIISPSPEGGEISLDMSFLNRLYSSVRHSRSMIPPWHDGRTVMHMDTRPYTKDGAYEMLLDLPDSSAGHFEFSRLDPGGMFYCRSAMLEETRVRRFSPADTPTLDPGYAVERVTETFLTGAGFARAMRADEETTVLGYSFRWGKLIGRTLHSWNLMFNYDLNQSIVRGNDQITAVVELPLSVAPGALPQYVSTVVQPLFTAFNWSIPANFVEQHVATIVRS